jgi:hypothetical protein
MTNLCARQAFGSPLLLMAHGFSEGADIQLGSALAWHVLDEFSEQKLSSGRDAYLAGAAGH